MEAGKARIEQLTAHLQEYSKRIQTLKTTMQVTALIQESMTDDGDEDDEQHGQDEEERDGEDGDVLRSSLFVSMEQRMRALGKECVRVMGRELFIRLYDYVAECRDAGVGEDDIEAGVRQREGGSGADDRWRRWRLIDQLIFMENHCDDDNTQHL